MEFTKYIHCWFDSHVCVWYDHIRDGCTGCELVPVVQCREDAMPFTCVPWTAILLLLSTLPPKWRATSLTVMMVDTQLCTGQPKRASCPWWSTSWNPVDLMWRHLARLVFIVCCLSDGFCELSGHTCCMGTVDMDTCTWVVLTSLVCVLLTQLLLCTYVYTSWCGTLLVYMSVPSAPNVSPSLHVQSGIAPLLRVARKGHAKVAQFLLGNGSSVTEEDNVGWPKEYWLLVII